MDFFESQEQARKRTKWLVLWFLLGMLGVVVSVNALVFFVFGGGFGGEEIAMISIVTAGVILAGSGFKSMQLNGGGAVVAQDLGGRLVMPGSTDFHEKRLLNIVEEMAIASGMPVPQVYLMDDEEGINAFAAGTEPSNAVVGVTRGCLQRLSRDELSGVVAHEFSHILNGDMRLNMRLMGLVFGLLILSVLGRMILHSLRFSTGSRRNSKEGGGVLAILALGVGLLVIGGLGAFFGRVIQAAVSRQREFLADASAVQFTRNPGGISGALKKIGGLAQGSKMQSAKAAEASHMFFSNGGMFSFGLATHPPLEVRIKEIEGSWDGRFEESEMNRVGAREEEKPQKKKGGFESFPGMAILGGLNELTGGGSMELSRGEGIHEGLLETWRAACHDRDEAQALIFGLLLAEDDELRKEEVKYLEEKAGSEATKAALKWQEEVRNLHSARKIALIEMALPTLRGLSQGEYQRFKELNHWLIESDGEVDLFEFMIQRVIARHLGSHFERQGFQKIRYRAFDRLLGEANVLVSAIAGVGNEKSEAADAAHAEATAVWQNGASREKVASLDELDAVLEKFDQASPLVKRQLLTACGKAVAKDGKVTSQEAELLRVIADSMGCPIPPFVGDLVKGEN